MLVSETAWVCLFLCVYAWRVFLHIVLWKWFKLIVEFHMWHSKREPEHPIIITTIPQRPSSRAFSISYLIDLRCASVCYDTTTNTLCALCSGSITAKPLLIYLPRHSHVKSPLDWLSSFVFSFSFSPIPLFVPFFVRNLLCVAHNVVVERRITNGRSRTEDGQKRIKKN